MCNSKMSVRPSVCPSHAGILSKRLYISLNPEDGKHRGAGKRELNQGHETINFGVRSLRSKVKVTRSQIYIWRPGGGIILNPLWSSSVSSWRCNMANKQWNYPKKHKCVNLMRLPFPISDLVSPNKTTRYQLHSCQQMTQHVLSLLRC